MVKVEVQSPKFNEWQLPSAASFIPHSIIFPSIWLVLAPIDANLGLFLGLFLTVFSFVIRFAMSKKIRVTETHLQVGKAQIPRKYLGEVHVIAKAEQFAQKGPSLDSRAYLALKGLPGLVKVYVTDKSDPTPYWLISTRKPELLQQALRL
jgi:hypothetical protein